MKLTLLFTLISTSLILFSCGIPGPKETTVELPSMEKIVSSLARSSGGSYSDAEDLFIFNFNAYSPKDQLYFQKTFTSENASEKINEYKLPNGKWFFYGLVYYYTRNSDGSALTQWVRCFYQETNLEGIQKEITLLIDQDSCKNIIKSSSNELPRLTFRRHYIDGSTEIFGADRSLKISFLNTNLSSISSTKNTLQINSKTSFYPSTGITTPSSNCFTMSETSGIPDDVNHSFYKLPFSQTGQIIPPVLMFIQGYVDESCDTPNPSSSHIVWNNWLSKDYPINTTQLSFVREINHQIIDPPTSTLYWTKEVLIDRSICIDYENCVADGVVCNTEMGIPGVCAQDD